MKLLPASLWLVQAKADRKAAVLPLAECQVRYLLQQAYEKALKALGIAILTPKQLADKQFSSVLGTYFLHHHTPMTVLGESAEEEALEDLKRAYPKDWEHLSKQLKTFRFELRKRLLDGSDEKLSRAWRQIDETRPSKDPKRISYRYPFFCKGDGVAPAKWEGWDDYQGPKRPVLVAVDEILRRAGEAVVVSAR